MTKAKTPTMRHTVGVFAFHRTVKGTTELCAATASAVHTGHTARTKDQQQTEVKKLMSTRLDTERYRFRDEGGKVAMPKLYSAASSLTCFSTHK